MVSKLPLLSSKLVRAAEAVTCQYLLLTQPSTPGLEALKISNCMFFVFFFSSPAGNYLKLSHHWRTWPREPEFPLLSAPSPAVTRSVQKGFNLAVKGQRLKAS